ncbi:MAG: glycosyltransferase, partial [Acetobacteraceae bacterium]
MRLLLATDSEDPSGVGHHMVTLASHLGPEWTAELAFAEGPAASTFLRRAGSLGIAAQAVALGGWEKLLRGRPGLLHIHAGIGWEGQALAELGKTAGWTVVRTEHLPWLITDPGQRQDYAAMLGHVDRLIAVSPSAGATLAAGVAGLGRKPTVHVVRNGISGPNPVRQRGDTRSALGVADDAPLLLHVARFTPQKAHLTLIAAFERVVRDFPAARLMLVGSGPTRDATEDAVRQAGLTGVTFSDPRDDVADLMAAADLLVLPSLFEGLPLVLLEAMASGLPIVATRTGGVVDALGPDHPFLVPTGSSDALGSAIVTALHDMPAARDLALHQQGRFADRFGAARMGRATAAVYRGAIDDTQRKKKTMQTLTNVGFVGAGGIATRHIEVLRRFPDVRLAAVTDPDQARATEIGARYGAQVYDSVDAMIAEAELDAIYICVPPFAHGPAERSALAAGLPFFVEKPITLDLDLAEALAAEVAERGLITAVGYHWRYLDTVERARRELEGNPVQLIVGHWLDSTPPPAWWGRQERSGGQMVEQVTHLIDTARYLAGAVESVHAVGNHLPRDTHPGLDVATASVATLRFEGGAIATFSATCLLNWAHRSGLHLFANGLAVELSDHEVMVDIGQGRHPVGAEGDPVWREDRDFIDAVRGKPNLIRTSYADALETHRVALAMLDSMHSGGVVRLPGGAEPARPPVGTLLRREPAAPDQHRR